MKALIKITAMASVFALAACGDKNEEDKKAEEMPAAEAPATSERMSTEETMEKVAEALKLDTSSLEAFKDSLANMKENLTPEESASLSEAMSKLAAKTADMGEDVGENMEEAGEDMMDSMKEGKSAVETLYEKMADELDGKTFEEIIAMADDE